MSVRQALIVLNAVAVAAIVVVLALRVFSVRRNPEPHDPQNKTPFLADEDLEGRRLERVLGWSLLFTVVLALALPVYFLVEPDRQESQDEDFDERSVERGAVLFANAESPGYDPTVSLLCADCHGVDGGGGSTTFTLEPEDPSCDPEAELTEQTPEECRPVQVTWEAPALDVAGLRYDRAALTRIITYGRPGTPMPAWGVASGEGVLNSQSVDDLVNYVESIQISPDEAKRNATEELEGAEDRATAAVEDAQEAVTAAQTALAETPPDQQASAERALAEAEANLAAAISWRDQVLGASDGELLFEFNCARCHTKGWSYYDPLSAEASTRGIQFDSEGNVVQGNGAFGPQLLGGSEVRQFPGATGVDEQIAFVAEGVATNRPYGARGISSGRMPHFNQTLTESQIELIVQYEREL
ncbi:MAG TPA: c-type cytochrome [Acidimicrobiia bacterium]